MLNGYETTLTDTSTEDLNTYEVSDTPAEPIRFILDNNSVYPDGQMGEHKYTLADSYGNITCTVFQDNQEQKGVLELIKYGEQLYDAKDSGTSLKEKLERDGYMFYVGTSYRHLLIMKNGSVVELTAPHDILTKRIGEYLPGDPVLREMMERSYDILKDHPINVKRRAEGKNPANSAWFWGAGTRPALTSFEEKNGVKGAMISAVDLLKGIAVGAGMHNIIVEGANGGLDTNYAGKGQAAVTALSEDGFDFVYVHIEAPDEMGHQGSPAKKIQAIESIDRMIIGPVVEALSAENIPFRMLVLPDHPTPVHVRTHTGDPVPYMLYDSTAPTEGKNSYSEKSGRETGVFVEKGCRLIDHLIEKTQQ